MSIKNVLALPYYTGNKSRLLNYVAISTGGFVDFDWFRINVGLS